MTSKQKTPFGIQLFRFVLIAQIVLCGLLTVVILYGITLPRHFSWGVNVVMAVIVLLIGLYFFLRLRAFRKVSAETEGLRQFVGWDLVLQTIIAVAIAGAVMGASFRVFSEGFSVFG